MISLKRPVYFITRQHKSNYQRLLDLMDDEKTNVLVATAYVLGAIGTIDEPEGRMAEVEASITDSGLNWDALLETMDNNPVDQALTRLAAHLLDNRPVTIKDVFVPLNDEYQAVAYQALLILFPSFSKSWEKRYEFADQD
ncbi:MAG: hypothetical protein ACOXZ6_06825 [Syntrophomonadaceae bacterium]|nr:hypothetical protein [Bacillota bacterium]NLP23211.1 hypothetical protein [Syntrophomonadaceae bacterium]